MITTEQKAKIIQLAATKTKADALLAANMCIANEWLYGLPFVCLVGNAGSDLKAYCIRNTYDADASICNRILEFFHISVADFVELELGKYCKFQSIIDTDFHNRIDDFTEDELKVLCKHLDESELYRIGYKYGVQALFSSKRNIIDDVGYLVKNQLWYALLFLQNRPFSIGNDQQVDFCDYVKKMLSKINYASNDLLPKITSALKTITFTKLNFLPNQYTHVISYDGKHTKAVIFHILDNEEPFVFYRNYDDGSLSFIHKESTKSIFEEVKSNDKTVVGQFTIYNGLAMKEWIKNNTK